MVARFDGLITAVETGVAGKRERREGGRGRGSEGYVQVLAALISL